MTRTVFIIFSALAAPTSAWLQPLAQRCARAGRVAQPLPHADDHDACAPLLAEPLPPAFAAANRVLVSAVKGAIDHAYKGRDVARFYVLETIARVPYFSYLSCLHLYESCGMRTSVKLMRMHYAESDNELHHLLIMEALGGSDKFADRFVAQHLAFTYYWYCVLMYLVHPRAAYHLSELIEQHAFQTYDAFLRENEDELRRQPVPEVARRYYEGDDLMNHYMLHGDDARAARPAPPAAARPPPRARRKRRKLRTLYDVFLEVRDDEGAHWDMLAHLVSYDALEAPEGCEVPLSMA